MSKVEAEFQKWKWKVEDEQVLIIDTHRFIKERKGKEREKKKKKKYMSRLHDVQLLQPHDSIGSTKMNKKEGGVSTCLIST
jgi:hypothetical protein